jgi:hypothetical protein
MEVNELSRSLLVKYRKVSWYSTVTRLQEKR